MFTSLGTVSKSRDISSAPAHKHRSSVSSTNGPQLPILRPVRARSRLSGSILDVDYVFPMKSSGSAVLTSGIFHDPAPHSAPPKCSANSILQSRLKALMNGPDESIERSDLELENDVIDMVSIGSPLPNGVKRSPVESGRKLVEIFDTPQAPPSTSEVALAVTKHHQRHSLSDSFETEVLRSMKRSVEEEQRVGGETFEASATSETGDKVRTLKSLIEPYDDDSDCENLSDSEIFNSGGLNAEMMKHNGLDKSLNQAMEMLSFRSGSKTSGFLSRVSSGDASFDMMESLNSQSGHFESSHRSDIQSKPKLPTGQANLEVMFDPSLNCWYNPVDQNYYKAV